MTWCLPAPCKRAPSRRRFSLRRALTAIASGWVVAGIALVDMPITRSYMRSVWLGLQVSSHVGWCTLESLAHCPSGQAGCAHLARAAHRQGCTSLRHILYSRGARQGVVRVVPVEPHIQATCVTVFER